MRRRSYFSLDKGRQKVFQDFVLATEDLLMDKAQANPLMQQQIAMLPGFPIYYVAPSVPTPPNPTLQPPTPPQSQPTQPGLNPSPGGGGGAEEPLPEESNLFPRKVRVTEIDEVADKCLDGVRVERDGYFRTIKPSWSYLLRLFPLIS